MRRLGIGVGIAAGIGLGVRRLARSGEPGRKAVTINRPRADVEEAWGAAEIRGKVRSAEFHAAPGGRGTELVVGFDDGRVATELADDLRCFKQRLETGEVARSDATPEGHALGRQLKQRPAQPLGRSAQ